MIRLSRIEELLRWLHEQRELGNEFPSIGRVNFHIYMRELTGGGVECNLRYDSIFEADIKIEERRLGVLTVSVVPNGRLGIDYTARHKFLITDEIQALREAFPNGRNIDLIVDELLKN